MRCVCNALLKLVFGDDVRTGLPVEHHVIASPLKLAVRFRAVIRVSHLSHCYRIVLAVHADPALSRIVPLTHPPRFFIHRAGSRSRTSSHPS